MELLYLIPSWQIALAFFVVLIAATEIGYLLGRRNHQESNKGTSSTFLGVMGAVLGLLSLLLAFSFSMAATRYDQRKQLLVKEANAIGTSYLRASLLGEQSAAKMRDLLRAYVEARITQHNAGIDRTEANQSAAEMEQLQTDLWELAAAQARSD